MIGQRFGRLVVTAQAPSIRYTRWHCLCDCGETRIVSRQLLMMGENGTRSCGCLKRDANRAAGRNVAPIGSAARWPKPDDGGRTLAECWK